MSKIHATVNSPQHSSELYPRIARRQQRTAPFSEFRGGRPCLDPLSKQISIQNNFSFAHY